MADALVEDYDVIELLTRLVGYSVDLLAADAAGLLVGDSEGTLLLVAASSEDARTIELLQLQAEEGPCVECFRTGAPVSVADLSQAADRWPRFAPIALRRHEFASVHALPLRLRSEVLGMLNLLHRAPGALPPEDLALGQAMADIATIGILQQRTIRRGAIVAEQL